MGKETGDLQSFLLVLNLRFSHSDMIQRLSRMNWFVDGGTRAADVP